MNEPARIDASPRHYPEGVELVRRSARGGVIACEGNSIADIKHWLLTDAIKKDELILLFESLVWRLACAGPGLQRASLHIGTLHPQLIGFGWTWNSIDGLCDETKVSAATRNLEIYHKSPLYNVLEKGERVRCDLTDENILEKYPLMAELEGEGYTDYMAFPLRAGGAYHNAMTIATQKPGGFTASDITTLDEVLQIFALHVERHIAMRLTGNVVDTYLGHAAGRKVLEGSIKRGSGEAICAIIWVSDLRDFTDLSDHLEGKEVTAILNAYFEQVAGAVIAHGGEVLKFIGDGLLAVFPHSDASDGDKAARAALAAARRAMEGIAGLNANPPGELANIKGWNPLRTGIALHGGEVFFGNVGAPERLDFTVIGRTVNEASRVEALSKGLGHSILITQNVATRLDEPLKDLGKHDLRGLHEPVSIFTPE